MSDERTYKNVKLVYVAGPFSGATRSDVESNIAKAVDVGLVVAEMGACPVIPHANTAHPRFEQLQDYRFWIDATSKLLTRCDALITVPGWKLSWGACGEVMLATELRIPVFHEENDLRAWLTDNE